MVTVSLPSLANAPEFCAAAVDPARFEISDTPIPPTLPAVFLTPTSALVSDIPAAADDDAAAAAAVVAPPPNVAAVARFYVRHGHEWQSGRGGEVETMEPEMRGEAERRVAGDSRAGVSADDGTRDER